MSDFKEEPGNMDNSPDNNTGGKPDNSIGSNKPPQNKKKNTGRNLLLGFGISAAAYICIWLIAITGLPRSVMALSYFVILGIFGFLTVKFFRIGYTVAAIIMLALISPILLALLLFGACTVLGFPF